MRALSSLRRVSALLGGGYFRLATQVTLVGPPRRVLSALEALGALRAKSVSIAPAKAFCRYLSRRPRSLKRSLLSRGRGLDKV